MVSFRRLIGPNPEGVAEAWSGAYLSLLARLSDCMGRVCMPAAAESQESLSRLQRSLSGPVTAGGVVQSGQEVESSLREWADRAARFFRERESESKELMKAIARTAEVVGERDRRYGPRFHHLAARLQQIAGTGDLNGVRAGLRETVSELNRTVEQMQREGQDTVAALQAELSSYRARLEVTEQAAWADALTGVANRRRAQHEIDRRMALGRTFCLLLADLNGLKRVNDEYGHNAGDELLTHFANEIHHIVRMSDVVARWGGDEFVVVLDCDIAAAESMLSRIRQWVFGAYTLQSVPDGVKVDVTAALGLAEWSPGMELQQLLEVADRNMYHDKASHRIARLG
jgi:diguanylate cyclase